MKASDFKKILKPLIKQTVKEVLLEDGILSSVVSEVARGLSGNLIVNENKKVHTQKEEDYEEQRQQRIKKLNESIKFGDVFKGTQEIQEQSNSPLSGIGPQDRGVDITAIEKIANGKWKRLI